jgi:hypothetical protein
MFESLQQVSGSDRRSLINCTVCSLTDSVRTDSIEFFVKLRDLKSMCIMSRYADEMHKVLRKAERPANSKGTHFLHMAWLPKYAVPGGLLLVVASLRTDVHTIMLQHGDIDKISVKPWSRVEDVQLCTDTCQCGSFVWSHRRLCIIQRLFFHLLI